jgi:hypothetical protein
VSWPGVVVSYALIGTLFLDFVENRLELPNGAHIVPDVHQILARVCREFLLQGLVVDIHRNIAQMNGAPGQNGLGFDDD